MRPSTIIKTTNRELAHELVRALHYEWRSLTRPGDGSRTAKKIVGYVAAVLGIWLITSVVLSAPRPGSGSFYPTHGMLTGLPIAVPDGLRRIPFDQVIALP